MIRQFWRVIFGLMLVSTAFTAVSWWYLVSTDIVLTAPAIREQLLSLPTSIPSIWNIIHPSTNISWLSPFVVLLVQVFLTGGFYGSLVRVNARQAVSPTTFLNDAARCFWRLFLWYLLWTAIDILLAGVVQVFPQMNVTLTVLVLLLRYLFLFADVALVSERSIPLAFQSAVGTLLSSVVSMLPYGVLLVFLTGFALSLSIHVSWLGLAGLAVVYGIAVTWLLHMVVARYVYFSNWAERSGVGAQA